MSKERRFLRKRRRAKYVSHPQEPRVAAWEPVKKKSAVLYVTADAFGKMTALVQGFSTEIGWHGFVRRLDGELRYELYDIAVYPQVVTGATTMAPDEGEYGVWRLGLDDFENERLHGHSHVDFGVFASSTDKAYYKEILSDLPEDSFYFFVILNKKGEWAKWLVDKRSGVSLFGDEVKVVVTDRIVEDARQIVKGGRSFESRKIV